MYDVKNRCNSQISKDQMDGSRRLSIYRPKKAPAMVFGRCRIFIPIISSSVPHDDLNQRLITSTLTRPLILT